jgi:hypothetical protein
VIATLAHAKAWKWWRFAWFYATMPEGTPLFPPRFARGTAHIRATNGRDYRADARGRAFVIWPPRRLFLILYWLPREGWNAPDGTLARLAEPWEARR